MNEINAARLEHSVILLTCGDFDGITRSPTTMNRIKSVFRSFFKWCFESGRLYSNPAIRLISARFEPEQTVPTTAEEVDRLLGSIQNSDDPKALRDEALFATYAFTGIRRSEALSLQVDDYNQSLKMLSISKSKYNRKRYQAVTPRLSRVLDRHIALLKKRHIHNRPLPLFQGRSPFYPLSTRQANHRFRHWKKLAGLREKLTIHSLRAGFATQLYFQTGDILLVSRALGHMSIDTTKRYILCDEKITKKAIEKAFG